MAMNDINQAHVAEILHISQPTLSQKISGRIRFSAQEIAILSDLFDVSADFLLGKSD
ncbi:MAG: helix-turn-helix transcriptional regulator [Scardovia wiggsiae]|nr:helix-turn-helix transcriptional regulator [Scardovia wiggsiae]